MLGDIVEAAAGQSYPAYVRDQILVPLGMASTDFMYRPEMVDRAATGYHPRHHPLTPLLRRMVPDGIFDHRVGRLWAMAPFLVDGPAYGGLVGTVEDAATFLRLHLGADDGRSRSVLSLESVAAMQRRSARGRKLDVALGWFRRGRDREADVPFWEHLGGGGGFWNVMRIYPQLDAGVVGMGNCTAWDHRRVTDALIGA